jgi:hypothetical protein
MTVRYAACALQLAAVLTAVPGGDTMRAEVADWTPTAGVNSPVFAVR